MTYAYFTNASPTNAFRAHRPGKHQKSTPSPPPLTQQDINTFKKNSSGRLLQDLLVAGWQLALRFGKRTTIHGLDRFLGARASRSERFLWFCTFLLALLGAIYVGVILSRRFSEGNFQTVVHDTRFPVYRVAFPVITICNQNRLNWQRIEQAKQRFLPGVNDTNQLALFERIIATYDNLGFGRFQPFGTLRNEPLDQLNHVNFSLVLEFMTWRCNEMLTNCIWRHYNYDCCEIFSRRRSKRGLCLSFNTLETEEGKRMHLLDPMWPWRTGGAGPMSGLNLRVLINQEMHYPNRTNEKGINIMVTEPNVWHREPLFVPAYTQTVVEIDPIIYFYDNETRVVSSDQRECVFNDEQNSQDFKSLLGYVYMIENCQSECHQEYLVRYCNCTMDLLFPPGQYRSCLAKDLPCLAQNNDFFIYSHQPGEEQFVHNNYEGMLCKCFRNCYSLNYLTDVRPSFLPPEIHGNTSYIDLDAHFRFETLMVYRTSLVFGWVDLMVSFGGIAGLFLGCSLISGMELAYFLCFEVPVFIFSGLRQRWRDPGVQSDETTIRTVNWSRTRFDIQNQLENYMMQTQKTNAVDNNWPKRSAWINNKHVISK